MVREKRGMIASNDIVVERAFEEDIPEIFVVEQECFSIPWSKKTFYETISNDESFFWKSRILNEVVGYIGIYSVKEENYVYNLAVKSRYRNLGVATKLLKSTINFCKNQSPETSNCGILNQKFLSLEVRKSNLPAINLYKKNGFKIQGIRKNFYSRPTEDALIMTIFSEVK